MNSPTKPEVPGNPELANKKNIMINPYASKAATSALLEASSDQQVLYTSEAVEQLADSLNTIIESSKVSI